MGAENQRRDFENNVAAQVPQYTGTKQKSSLKPTKTFQAADTYGKPVDGINNIDYLLSSQSLYNLSCNPAKKVHFTNNKSYASAADLSRAADIFKPSSLSRVNSAFDFQANNTLFQAPSTSFVANQPTSNNQSTGLGNMSNTSENIVRNAANNLPAMSHDKASFLRFLLAAEMQYKSLRPHFNNNPELEQAYVSSLILKVDESLFEKICPQSPITFADFYGALIKNSNHVRTAVAVDVEARGTPQFTTETPLGYAYRLENLRKEYMLALKKQNFSEHEQTAALNSFNRSMVAWAPEGLSDQNLKFLAKQARCETLQDFKEFLQDQQNNDNSLSVIKQLHAFRTPAAATAMFCKPEEEWMTKSDVQKMMTSQTQMSTQDDQSVNKIVDLLATKLGLGEQHSMPVAFVGQQRNAPNIAETVPNSQDNTDVIRALKAELNENKKQLAKIMQGQGSFNHNNNFQSSRPDFQFNRQAKFQRRSYSNNGNGRQFYNRQQNYNGEYFQGQQQMPFQRNGANRGYSPANPNFNGYSQRQFYDQQRNVDGFGYQRQADSNGFNDSRDQEEGNNAQQPIQRYQRNVNTKKNYQ